MDRARGRVEPLPQVAALILYHQQIERRILGGQCARYRACADEAAAQALQKAPAVQVSRGIFSRSHSAVPVRSAPHTGSDAPKPGSGAITSRERDASRPAADSIKNPGPI